MAFKDYKVAKHNSTACGYPGREFDWSQFCWDNSHVLSKDIQKHWLDHAHKGSMACQVAEKGYHAPDVYVDDYFIGRNCQYLHVPYRWRDDATIYRVRPNETMCAGQIYRGHLIKKQTAIKKEDGWYWRLEFDETK